MNRRGGRAAPAPARVDLRIDELTLHGVAPGDRHRVADAIGRELARLIADHGLPTGLGRATDDARAPAPGPAIVVSPSARSDDLGRGVAGAIYRALAPAAGRSSREGGS